MLTKPEIRDAHSYKIFIKNDLIQKGTSILGLEEWKMMLYLISKVKQGDEPHKPYVFKISEYCQICNKTKECGVYMGANGYISQTLEKLRIHKLQIELSPKRRITMGWISSHDIDDDNDTVAVRFDANISKYIFFNLDTGNFTATVLEMILPMRSTYGILLYLLLRSYKSERRTKKFALDELRKILGCADKYEMYKDFRVNVLEPAIKDIKDFTDIDIDYDAPKTGKKVSDIVFTYKKITADEHRERAERCQKKLGTLPKAR